MRKTIFHLHAAASCNNGDARLVNGSSPLEGRVEVCVNQGNFTQWGSVCTPLDIITAAVVCRQLHLADNSKHLSAQFLYVVLYDWY